jgi:carbon storage regulator
MLVLGRKEGEQFVIGDNVVITINRILNNRVTVGIDAPREVRIVRRELERHQKSACDSRLAKSATDGTAVDPDDA